MAGSGPRAGNIIRGDAQGAASAHLGHGVGRTIVLALLVACGSNSTVPLDASQDAPADAGRTYLDAVTDYASAFCSWQSRCYDTEPGACVDAMVRDVCQRVPCGEAYPAGKEAELEMCRVGLEQAWCAPFPSQAVCEGAVGL